MALVTSKPKPKIQTPAATLAPPTSQKLNAGGFDAFFAAADAGKTPQQAVAAALAVPPPTNSSPAPTGATPGFDAFFKAADTGNAAQSQTAFDLAKSGTSVQDAVAQALSGGGGSPTPTSPSTPSDPTQSTGDSTMPPGQDPRTWAQMDWESRNMLRRQAGIAYQEPQPEADRAADASRASQATPPPPPPPPINQPLSDGPRESSPNAAAPNINDQNYAAAQAAPVTTAGNTAFAKAQDPGTRSLIERQDLESQRQNNLVQNLVYNANTAGQQAVKNLGNPQFITPNVNTAFGTQVAAPRQKAQYEILMEQALQNMLQNSENSPAYRAQLQQYNTQADEDLQNLLSLLQSTGNLRGSGTAPEQMSKYYGGVSQGRANLFAQQDAARQAAIQQALGLSGMNQSNELAQGQLLGNLRGATTLQAQMGQAQTQMGLADMFNKNQQFGANYNLAKLGLGQDIANQELNRAMTVTSPTQREYFTQAQNQNMIGNELARAGMTGILGGQQTMQGQMNAAQVTGQNLANTSQQNINSFQPQMLQSQLTGMNYANTGQDIANSTAQMLQPGMLTQQQAQNRILGSQAQLAQQQADLDKALQTGVIDQQTYQTESMRLVNQAQGTQNTMLQTQSNFLPQQLQQGLDLGTANLRGMNLANDQSQAMNPLLLQALGLQNTNLSNINQFQPQLLQNQVTQGNYANTGLDLANQATRLQNQFLPEQLRGNQTLQGQQIQLGNRAITAADLANTAQSTQNQFQPQLLGQQVTLGGQQIYSNTLANDLQEQLNPLQVRQAQLSNQGIYNQNQLTGQAYDQNQALFPGQLTQQGLQTRGMELSNDINWANRRGLDQAYSQNQALFPGQLPQQGLQTRGMELGNDQIWRANRGMDQQYAQSAQMFPGQLTMQGQALTQGNQQIGGFDQQQSLNRVAQILAAQNADVNLGQDTASLIAQALGIQLPQSGSQTKQTPQEIQAKANPGMILPDGSWYDQYGRKHFPGETG